MTRFLLAALAGAVLLSAVGCSGGPPANPAGPEANSGKTYTKEDAINAVPKRNGSGE